MSSLLTVRLRELLEDPDQGFSNDFLRELLAYIQRLEEALRISGNRDQ